MIVMRITTGVRSHFVTRMPEWGLSGTLFAFAVLLMGPGDSFSYSRGYQMLGRHVTETTWGRIALAISITWLIALVLNGSFRVLRRWSPWVRSVCAIFASGFWGTNAFFIGVTAISSPGLINNAGFAVLALAASAIIAREVGAVDGNAKKCQSPQTTG